MSDNPLNKPRDIGGIENIIELFNCIVDEKNATYVSAPITTGQRFLAWFKEKGRTLDPESTQYKNEHFQEVIQPNKEEVKTKIAGLRRNLADSNPFLIDPTVFNWPEWNQDDYRYFWGRVIERYIKRVVFMDGWQYSSGCTFEFFAAVRSHTQTLTEQQTPLDPDAGLQLIKKAIDDYNNCSIPSGYLHRVATELENWLLETLQDPLKIERLPDKPSLTPNMNETGAAAAREFLKDETVERLAMIGNVAQFASFAPDQNLSQRFSRVAGFNPNHSFASPQKAIESLLANSPEGTVNVRSFLPGKQKGEPLLYGIDNVEKVLEILKKKAAENKYTIVNETIDIHDGGVSGVAIGHVLEFSPADTPKCVDKPGVCRLPRDIGLNLLEKVYGFRPILNFPFSYRVEFSIHPKKRGIRHGHTITWEMEEVNAPSNVPEIQWPNNFSRMLGDKVYGLLIADCLGLPVPQTTVITRHIAPFTFGIKTGTSETWLRTCPAVRAPGRFPTYFGWRDPFELIAQQPLIASVLAQEAIHPEYSGSLVPGQPDGTEPLIEGVRGMGDAFMVGEASPQELPGEVTKTVRELYLAAFHLLGPLEMEWVYDGKKAWVVQLHKSRVSSSAEVIYPGEPGTFVRFNVGDGLEALRESIALIKGQTPGVGIILVGDIGITSHFGDILRKAEIPSRVEKP